MSEEAKRQQPKVIDLEVQDYRADGVSGEKMFFGGVGLIRFAYLVALVVVMYNFRDWLQAHIHLF